MIDIDALLTDAKIEYRKEEHKKNGNIDAHTKYFMQSCLFDSGHGNKDATIIQYDKGSIVYKCLHNSCKDRKWKDCIKYFQDKGVDTGKYTDATPKPKNENIKNSFSLIKLCDIQFKQQDWLIKSIIPADSLNQIFGDPGSMKSFLAIDMTACIATGSSFYGMKTKQAPVIFIAGEGFNGLKMRFMAWSIKNQISLDDAPIYLSSVPVSIGNPESIEAALSVIDQITTLNGTPALIVIDTVARNFGNGDENSTKDMNAFINGCDTIRAKYNCAVLLVHHSGHADKNRGRGAMALLAALDTAYKTYKDENDILRFECTKMKDGQKSKLAFTVHTVELGITDEEDEPLSSVALNRTEYEAPPKKGKQGRGKNQSLAITLLKDLYQQHKDHLEAGGYDPENAKVKESDWKNVCFKSGIEKSSYSRLVQSLLLQKIINIESGYVFINSFCA